MSFINMPLQQNSFSSTTDEVLFLRKELRIKDAEHSKEKALLNQKVEQLEQKLKDAAE